ncbi:hypothetical protein CVT26_009450 [Gymnopilus dilepis]|uniref:Uncharacterized protein n=1 Tax=Gymnopilus dilepis TaxID=231916 RepID=A0A409YI83_9AGAR|nr:hypothetical protein CVT26_009450 [Gymnopilus dilepis]
MTSSLTSSTLQHTIPDDFDVPRSRPWDALKVFQNHPYIITADDFGAATTLWSFEGGEAKVVTTLNPPLPSSARILNSNSLVVSAPHGVLVLLFHDPKGKKSPIDVARMYSLGTGELVQELELGFEAAWDTLLVSGDTLILTAKEHDRRPKVVWYTLSANGLEKEKEGGTDLPDGLTAGMERLVPLYLVDAGSLVTSSTSFPSNKLEIRLLDHRATITASHATADYIAPGPVVQVDDSLVLAVTEAEFDQELSPAYATIHKISLSDLSPQWSKSLPYKVIDLTYHPALQALVVLGWKDAKGSVSEGGHEAIVTFLRKDNGDVLAERTFPWDAGLHALTAKCTPDDNLVVVSEAGEILVVPLQSVLDSGLPLKEDGRLAMQPSPVRPEPYNTKAAKAGASWKWVKKAIVGPGAVVLFALRGPEFYAVRW